MRLRVFVVCAALCLAAVTATAQSTTGTIAGRVVDAQGLPVPGVAVTVTSPNLQGVRETVTSGNGDYIVSLLPSGVYSVSFELSGFGSQTRSVSVAPTQIVPLEVEMGPAAVTETVQVVGRSADVFVATAQVATNFSQELIAELPTARDINATLMLSPSVHPTGPGGRTRSPGRSHMRTCFLLTASRSTRTCAVRPTTCISKTPSRKRRWPPQASRRSAAASGAAS